MRQSGPFISFIDGVGLAAVWNATRKFNGYRITSKERVKIENDDIHFRSGAKTRDVCFNLANGRMRVVVKVDSIAERRPRLLAICLKNFLVENVYF